MSIKKLTILIFFIFPYFAFSQSDIDKILKGGEIIVNGLSFLKKDKSEVKETNSKVIESICIKNKLTDKITFIISGKDSEDNTVKKKWLSKKTEKNVFLNYQKAFIHMKLF